MAVPKKFVRINSGIRPDQHKYVKSLAKETSRKEKRDVPEAEIIRNMIDFYIERNK